ncbi:alpha/beta fold hydrolase [Roseateles violae]|uniref:Alpha/beta hydrolase n=1 Tax=Roseateles violae TaxID=3058042 RepID=A0ABT8DXT6_9BURK|nr:alpha/beta hydrolase [Pelomonas sp. PFR6]MDN3921616.1 alpha/beta hydrolase [Pelomonas sp. PFR6]
MQIQVNGQSAYAYTGGKPFNPALPCIVFIHGAMNDHSVWTLLARSFAHHGHGVLAVDLPGHGRSGGAPLDGVEQMADWIWALLDAAGVDQAALVGHSMGSLIALEAAGRRPERATRLALVGTAYPMKVSEALLSSARETPLQAIEMVNNFSLSSLAAKPSYPGPGAWLHGGERALKRRMLAGTRHPAPGGAANLFEHDFSCCDRYAGGLEAASRVQCPAGLILGERDQMTSPKQTAALAEALKAEIFKLPAGHSLMAEASEQMLTTLRQVLG